MSTSAMRFIFSLEGGQVRLVSRQAVEMTLLPGLPLDQRPDFAAEVRSAAGEVLHRVAIPNTLRNVEVYAPQGETIFRADVAHPSGAFTVVVPAPEEADHVALVARRGGVTGRLAESAEPEVIARFAMYDEKAGR